MDHPGSDARAEPVSAVRVAYESGVTRYSATPSGGTVKLIFPADEMSNVVWPPTTVDWLPQTSCTWQPSGSAGTPIFAAVVEMVTGLELTVVVVLNSPTTASPRDSTLAN